MAGNKIGVEGTKSMSEMLKVNTTLTCLGLESDEERKERLRMKSTLKRLLQTSLFQFLLVSLMRGMDSSGLTAVPGTLAARSSRRKRAKTEARMERPPPKTMA